MTERCSVVPADPCLNHHCKKGKVCEIDEDNSPMCVCQDPSSCPAAMGEFEHVSLSPDANSQIVNETLCGPTVPLLPLLMSPSFVRNV